MPIYRCEIYNDKCETIYRKWFDLPEQTLEQAEENPMIKKIKKEVKHDGNVFRLIKEG